MRHFLIFGRHPWLSLAETKAVLGGYKPELIEEMAIFDTPFWEGSALMETLGGTVKLGEVWFEGEADDLNATLIAKLLAEHPRGDRIEFGLTVYGGTSQEHAMFKNLPIQLKRLLQDQQRAVRWVTGEAGDLTPAAVEKAKLTTIGYDLCIGLSANRVVIGATTHVQNATSWSKRDYEKPFSDPKTGMLPPKLARMMVNLALNTKHATKLLDPFCGSGTVLMEAAMVAAMRNTTETLHLLGSDIDATQVNGAKQNMQWLFLQEPRAAALKPRLFIYKRPAETLADHHEAGSIDAIVTEGYLGKPQTGRETLLTLQKQKSEVDALWQRCLPVFARLQPKGGKLVCVWPIFVGSGAHVAIDAMEAATKAGYRELDPLQDWAPATPLIYSREDQHVQRRVFLLEKT
jgi:tRNA G10  N-methylase Trm11